MKLESFQNEPSNERKKKSESGYVNWIFHYYSLKTPWTVTLYTVDMNQPIDFWSITIILYHILVIRLK